MAVLAVEQSHSGSALGLTTGLTDLLIAEFGGRNVLYAMSRSEKRLLELEIAPDGSLSLVSSLALVGDFASGSYPELELIRTGGASHLAIGGLAEADGQSVSLGGSGSLGTQQSLTGFGTPVAPAHLSLSGIDAVLTGRQGQGGIDLFTDSAGLSYLRG